MPGLNTSDRTLRVLELFDGSRGEWSVEEAADALQVPVSTAYRYFRSLSRVGLIVASLPGRYVLGPAITRLDRQMRLHDPLIAAARPIMRQLAQEVGSPNLILLTKLYRATAICVHEEQLGTFPVPVSYERGRPMPLDRGAPGKVILANLPRRAARLTDARSDHALDNDLRPELKRIRSLGFATSEGEIDAGVRGLSAPVFRADTGIEGSLSIVLPSPRQLDQSLIDLLLDAKRSLEAQLSA